MAMINAGIGMPSTKGTLRIASGKLAMGVVDARVRLFRATDTDAIMLIAKNAGNVLVRR